MIEPGSVSAETWTVVGGRPGGPGEPLNHPISPATTFRPGGERWYSRNEGNDTLDALEEVIGGLDGGETVVFSSGLAAAAAVFDLVPMGGRLVLPVDCYHGSVALATRQAEAGRFAIVRVGVTDTEGWVEQAAVADLLWIESPSNPLLEVADLGTICSGTRRALVAVDATMGTPLGPSALATGADLVMHSATKFIGGHSDLLAGTVTGHARDLVSRVRETRRLGGGFPGALEVYLALRGVRTLALRFEKASHNALVLVGRLRGHRSVETVFHPGWGSMVSFSVRGGDDAADHVCRSVRVIAHATSLGGVESSIERRSGPGPGTEHLPPGLIRFNVGIESVEDLWSDLATALDSIG